MAVPMMAQTTYDNPWKGKKVAYFGDSITDPRNNGSKKKYWNFLQELFGITPYVYGISGREWNDIPNQAERLQKEHGNDFDAITIFLGTNDFNNAIPIGEWFTESDDSVVAARNTKWPKAKYLRKKRTPIMDVNTFRGRINIAMSKLKTMYPTKQIVIITPIHRSYFYGNEKNIQPSEEYTNQIGVFFDEYVKSVKEAGNIWSVPVIDLNSVSGLYPVIKEGDCYFHNEKDLLHPNDAGHLRMAKTIYYQLAALPCVF